jgi:hypothetical protein
MFGLLTGLLLIGWRDRLADLAASVAAGLRPATLQLATREAQPLVVDVDVRLRQPAGLYVEYGTEQLGWLRTPLRPPAPQHQLALTRLRPATGYTVRAVAVDDAGRGEVVSTGEVMTGPLPVQLQRLQVDATGEPSLSLTLMDLRPPGEPGRWLVALDRAGQVVWYYPIPPEMSPDTTGNLGQATGNLGHAVVQRANGNLLYLAPGWGIDEITPTGELVQRFKPERKPASQPHHDLLELADGRILYLASEDRFIKTRAVPGAEERVRGDALVLADRASGETRVVWSTFDLYDPQERPSQYADQRSENRIDWTHSNSISLGPRGNVLISVRYLDQIVSLAPDLARVEWRLGGLGSSFSFPDPTDRFYSQHSASEPSTGHILLFDNGNFRPDDEYSRGLELELDLTTMTARKIWELRHDPDIYSDRIGNALRLPGGNTLVNFGFPVAPSDPVTLVEATPDGRTVWEQRLSFRGWPTSRYRAYSLSSLAGEREIP